MIHILTLDAFYTLNVVPDTKFCDSVENTLGVVVIDRKEHTVAISSPDFLEAPIRNSLETFIEIEDKINEELL